MKNRTALFAGLALFLSFALLTAAGKVSGYFSGKTLLIAMIFAELLAFIIPLSLIRATTTKDKPIVLRTFLKVSTPSVFNFTFFSSIAVAILTFLINYTLFKTTAAAPAIWESAVHSSMETPLGKLLVLAAFLLISPIFEELFLRGALLSAHEKLVSTGTAILLSGICFAMLHGSFDNFIGPLLAGMLYAYYTYSFDCIWPAIIAHIINNLYVIVVMWLTQTYSAFGIWEYFPEISLILLLAFLYLALQSFETLLITDKIRQFKRTDGAKWSSLSVILSPGFFVFLLAFTAKAVFKLF